MNSQAISPYFEKESVWKSIHLERLREIVHQGRIQPKYKHKPGRRFWNVISTAVCIPTCCLPCVAWDTACCCMSVCCDHPFKWGCTCTAVSEVCNESFKDTRDVQLTAITSEDISIFVMQHVCTEYLRAFDHQVALRTVDSARKANIIRSELFAIIRKYTPGFKYITLRDDGDINKVRNIVHNLKDVYSTPQGKFMEQCPR